MNTQISPGLPKLALIAGPTASGKSALALRLAELANGTIINADASQLYSDLPIISAMPSQAEMVRVPHRLFGHVDGSRACSAAEWAANARFEIEHVWQEGALPILVGGTGLYIRTLLEGIAPVPPIDPEIRAAVRSLPVAEAYAALSVEDPKAAARLRPTDTTRVARALEVVRSTGRPLADWQKEKVGGIAGSAQILPRILLPPRDWLHTRCNDRFEAMLEAGAAEEVRALLARGLPPDLPVMRAIGVPEIIAWLAGEIDRQTMIARAQAATRRYAKRQYTWFSHQLPAEWPGVTKQLDDTNAIQLAIKLHSEVLTD